MARVQPTSLVLQNHPPKDYYEMWAEKMGVPLQKYPYLKKDFDPSKDKVLPFAVYDFNVCRNEDGQQVAMVEVRYKSLFSKSTFTVLYYL